MKTIFHKVQTCLLSSKLSVSDLHDCSAIVLNFETGASRRVWHLWELSFVFFCFETKHPDLTAIRTAEPESNEITMLPWCNAHVSDVRVIHVYIYVHVYIYIYTCIYTHMYAHVIVHIYADNSHVLQSLNQKQCAMEQFLRLPPCLWMVFTVGGQKLSTQISPAYRLNWKDQHNLKTVLLSDRPCIFLSHSDE